MAAGEKKVSLMTHITSAPGDTKIYIVLPDGSYGYIEKDEFLAGMASPITPFNTTAIFDETPIAVPEGFTGIVTNLNNIYADVTFTVVGTELTITGGADTGEKLLINGKY